MTLSLTTDEDEEELDKVAPEACDFSKRRVPRM